MIDSISIIDPPDSFEDRIPFMVCMIEIENENGSFKGSGFIYHQLYPPTQEEKKKQYRRIKGQYVITNRHVVYDLCENEKEPQELSLNFRTLSNDHDESDWHEILLNSEQVRGKVWVHQNSDIDIAVIDIGEFKNQIPKSGCNFTEHDLIGHDEKVKIECSDDIIVTGFPEGFYDEENIFPIVKHGIISSGLKMDFNDEPYFLIDLKLFPGSSGSVVLTKPAEYFIVDGQIHPSRHGKQFWLLGIYSGDPYVDEMDEEISIDVGIVWHARLFEEIIEYGIPWNIENKPTVAIGSMVRPRRSKQSM